jgi:hypothetical protein
MKHFVYPSFFFPHTIRENMTDLVSLNVDSGEEWKIKKCIIQSNSLRLGMRLEDVCRGIEEGRTPTLSLGDEKVEDVNFFLDAINIFSCFHDKMTTEYDFKEMIPRAYPLLKKYECHGIIFFIKTFLSNQSSEEYLPSVLSVLSVEDEFEWVNEGIVNLLKRYCLKGDMKTKSTIIDLTTSETEHAYHDEVGSRMRRIPFSILARMLVS